MVSSGGVEAITTTTAELLLDIRQAATGRGHARGLAELSGIEVSSTERWVLHAVPGQALVPVTQVALAISLDLPAASRACARLEKQGHVIRIRDPRDGRRTLVGLTDATWQAITRWDDLWPAPYAAAATGWSPTERATLRDWVRLVVDEWPIAIQLPARRAAAEPPDNVSLDSLVQSVRALVTAAGHADLLDSVLAEVADGHTTTMTPAVFHALRTIVTSGTSTTVLDLAGTTDVDRSLAGRRLRTLISIGAVERLPGSDRHHVATDHGRELVRDVVAARAALLPTPPPHLVEAGLERLLDAYVAALGA